jgi:hypothetical protein
MSKAGQDGTKGEVAIVSALKPYYPMVERRGKEGWKDRGDIGGVAPHLVIEAKHCPKRYEISEWLKETDREGENDRAELAVVWFKLKGTTSALDWPVMMRGHFFIPLLQLWTASRGIEQANDPNQLKLF